MSKSFILDTNILIDNPDSIEILRDGDDENKILIPYSVVLELDRLKMKPDLSYIVHQVSNKLLNDDKVEYIKHDESYYNIKEVGDEEIINDIKLYISKLSREQLDKVIVVSNDKIFRVKCKMYNWKVQEFKSSRAIEPESQEYTGFKDSLNGSNNYINSFEWYKGKPYIYISNQDREIIDYDPEPWTITPRSKYQSLAAYLMLHPRIDVVSVQSAAGLGKTYLSLASAMELLFDKKKEYNKLYIVRPTVEIGEKLGFLPGEMSDKLDPYFKPVSDLLHKLHEARPINRIFADAVKGTLNPKKCEFLPLNYLRGMNLENSIVIIDEAQNITRLQMRTILTRMGQNVKCIILGDTNQVDHPYLNKYNNGLNWIVKKFTGRSNYGHIVLKGSKSRGPITDLVLSSDL